MKQINMYRLMKKLTLAFCLLMITNSLLAQEAGGEFSMGPRFGGITALSMKKHAHSNKSAIELIPS